jgi:hypothetical protein
MQRESKNLKNKFRKIGLEWGDLSVKSLLFKEKIMFEITCLIIAHLSNLLFYYRAK